MKLPSVSVVLGTLVGLLCVVLAAPGSPRPRLRTTNLDITQDHEVTPSQPLPLDFRFADFDLHCHVEIPKGGELDLVFRKVEHWGEGHLPLFHTRFAALRMSSYQRGPGLLTRGQELFEPGVGGVLCEPGPPGVSLELRCRGRQVTALVNGQDLRGFETTDDFGNFAFVARGGTAVVHDLEIKSWPREAPSFHWWIGAGVGALLALLFVATGGSLAWSILALLVTSLGALVARWTVFAALLTAVDPEPVSVLFAGFCLAPVGLFLGLGWPGTRVRLALALVAGLPLGAALLELAARSEAPRLSVSEDPRLDLYFGPDSGTGILDAVTRRMTARFEIHTLEEGRYDVLLLGGRSLFDYEGSDRNDANVTAILPATLRAKLRLPAGKSVRCAAIPTNVANAFQQYLLLREFYTEYRPRVVVLGLTDFEAEVPLPLPPRAMEDFAARPRDAGFSVLLDAMAPATPPSRQSPEDLQATLRDVRALCKDLDARLVLVLDDSLPREFLGAAQSFAANERVPFVTGFSVYEGRFPIEVLTETVLGELIR